MLGGVAASVLTIGGFLGGFLPRDRAEVTFLSVGQGDCALIRMEGTDMLVDAGPARQGSDAGEALVVPKLRERGVATLSLIFLTHPDGDHVGGTGAVLRRYPGAKLVVNAAFREHPDLTRDLAVWRMPASSVLWVSGECRFRIGGGTVHCYAPLPGEDDNAGSLTLLFEDRGAKAVFSGDAPAETLETSADVDDWSAQLAAVGHHGSRTACSEAWYRRVHPRYAVISCGRDNTYGHPHRQTVDLLLRDGIEAHRTDLEGDVRFVEEEGRFVYRR